MAGYLFEWKLIVVLKVYLLSIFFGAVLMSCLFAQVYLIPEP